MGADITISEVNGPSKQSLIEPNLPSSKTDRPEMWQLVGAVADAALLITGHSKQDGFEIAMGVSGLLGQGLNFGFRNSPHLETIKNYTNTVITAGALGLVYDGLKSGDGYKELTGVLIASAFTMMIPPVARFLKRVMPEKHLFIPQSLLIASTGAMGALANSAHSKVLGVGALLYLVSNWLMPTNAPCSDSTRNEMSNLRRPNSIDSGPPLE